MWRLLSIAILAVLVTLAPGQGPAARELSGEAEFDVWKQEFQRSLTPHRGTVILAEGRARLEVPEAFYFLSAEDAERVLVEAWGNPPDPATLGMVLPLGASVLGDRTWAVTISYEEEGYVSDADAGSIEFDEILETLRADAATESAARMADGYDPVELIGWAEPPAYDKTNNRLYWAQELRFGETEGTTLNYSIRILGRNGVLVLNFVSAMAQLEEIKQHIPAVLAMASFQDGHRYADFDPAVDQVAAYGLSALVAGKVLAKTGVLAGVLLVVKKLWVYLLLVLGGGLAAFSRRLRKA